MQELLPIEELVWDSNFFKRKIGRIIVNENNELLFNTIHSIGKEQGYELLYIYSELPINANSVNQHKNVYSESRIIYSKEINNHIVYPPEDRVRIFTINDNVNDLYKISYEIGRFSRFNKDNKFSNKEFKRFYRKWVDNSLLYITADLVFIYEENSKALAFITAKKSGLKVKIELIGVDKQNQGKGIGKLLLDHLYFHLNTFNIKIIDVVTQSENRQACRFYEKNGFVIYKKIWLYHFWL